MTFKNFALSTLLIAIPSLSQALTLDCRITPSAATGGYVTEQYVIQVEDGADKAIVSDGLILYYNDNQPITAKVSENTSKKMVLSWNVQMTNGTGQITKMQFRAAYFKAESKITVRAVPGGYANDFEGRGKCKPV